MEARRFEEALQENDRVLRPETNFVVANRTRWNINTRMHRYEDAAAGLRAWLVGAGRDEAAADQLAGVYAEAARAFGANGTAGTLPEELIDRLNPGVEIEGQLYASVGDREKTLELLEQGYRERAGARNLLSIGINPLYDFLREDPAFQDLVRRIGLRRAHPPLP